MTALYRWPTQKARKALRERVAAITSRSSVGRDIAEVVGDLNPVIRGWGNYFADGQSAPVFGQLDMYIRMRLSILESHKHKRRNLLKGCIPRMCRSGHLPQRSQVAGGWAVHPGAVGPEGLPAAERG